MPDSASELVSVGGLAADWPDDPDLTDTPESIIELVRRGVWLEQEALAIDPRTPPHLEAWPARELSTPMTSEPGR